MVIALFMLGLLLGPGRAMLPAVAAAELSVTVTGDGVTNPKTFTLAELKAIEDGQVGPRHYSTINTWPTKGLCAAEGVNWPVCWQRPG